MPDINFTMREKGAYDHHTLIRKRNSVPRVFIRKSKDSASLSAQIVDFLRANRQSIHGKRLLCNFRTPDVAPHVVSAIENATRSPEAEGIGEVVIMSPIE